MLIATTSFASLQPHIRKLFLSRAPMCACSSFVHSMKNFGQSSTFELLVASANGNEETTKRCTVRVIPTWTDEFHISGTFTGDEVDKLVESTDDNGRTNIAMVLMPKQSTANVTVSLPEHSHLSLESQTPTNVEVGGKLEGNVSIRNDQGDISVNKVRGEDIVLISGDGHVTIRSMLEGQQCIRGLSVAAKRLMGKSIDIMASGINGISVGAVYGGNYTLRASNGAVSVDAVQGTLAVECAEDISVGGMDGDVKLLSAHGDVSVHFESVPAGTVSTVSVPEGDVKVSVNHDVTTRVHLKGDSIDVPTHLQDMQGDEKPSSNGPRKSFEDIIVSSSVPGRSSLFESGKIRTAKNTGWDTECDDLGTGSIVATANQGQATFRIASWIEQTLKRVERKQREKEGERIKR